LANVTYLSATIKLANNKIDEAIRDFSKAEVLGIKGRKFEYVHALLAAKQYEKATEVAKGDQSTGLQAQDFEIGITNVTVPLAQQRNDSALRELDLMIEKIPENDSLTAFKYQIYRAGLTNAKLSNNDALQNAISKAKKSYGEFTGQEKTQFRFQLLIAAWYAAKNESLYAANLMGQYTALTPANNEDFRVTNMLQIVKAQQLLSAKQYQSSIALLEAASLNESSLYITRAVLLEAYEAAGNQDRAQQTRQWLKTHHGLAFAEPSIKDGTLLANVKIASSLDTTDKTTEN
jgi:predicted Zn-dependent protease